MVKMRPMKIKEHVEFYGPKEESGDVHGHKGQTCDSRRLRRNQIDPTAVFIYSLGCSLVHFAMCISSLTIKGVDIERAKQLDIEHAEMIKAQLNPLNFL